ncbi:MAG: polysaccharide polymerase [uncultured bacterium]|nr:MAG: polysaccharide polymerase [uncultured bacterium]
MFSSTIKKIKTRIDKEKINYFLMLFCVFLPFQFALNPREGIDLAIVRIIIPLVFLIWMLSKFKNKERFFTCSTQTWLLLLFFFLAFFSLIFSSNISWSIRKLLFLLSIAPIYFISISVFKNDKLQRLILFSFIVGASLLSWVAILQFASQFIFSIDHVYSFLANISPFFLGNSFSTAVLAYPSWLVNVGGITYMRAIAVFPDPHMLSYYLEMLLPWSIALWATTQKNRTWLLICVLSLLLANILTFTRGSYIALIAGSLIVLPLVTKKTALKIIIGAIFFLFLTTVTPHDPVTERLASSFDVQEGSNQERLSNWKQSLVIIANHPFGVGIGAYSLAVKSTANYREPIYAHNLYLDIAAELGIFASLVFIALLLTALKNFWIASKTQPFFIAGVASVIIFSVHSLVENPLFSVHVLPLFLIILALSSSIKPNKENDVIK